MKKSIEDIQIKKEKSKLYRERNKEKISEKKKMDYRKEKEENIEEMRKKAREYAKKMRADPNKKIIINERKKAWRKANPEKSKLESKKRWQKLKNDQNYKNKQKQYIKKYSNEHILERRVRQSKYAAQNRSLYAAQASVRRVRVKKGVINNLYKKEILQEFYLVARDLAWLNEGTKFEVDHIIPLANEHVCGLHVPWNLQLLTSEDNKKKTNSFDGTYENNSWRN
jgi:5-methylcytosine-specific restriction endonuclease McrA